MKDVYVSIFVCLFVLIGCKKQDDIPCTQKPISEEWEKFIGEYKVYDELNNYLYDISICHFFKGNNVNGDAADSLKVENFLENFDLKFEFVNKLDKSVLDLGQHNPLIDFDNKRWYFWSNADDPETEVIENSLVNDTIVIPYLLDNTAYWLSDGVPFYSCDCKLTAVKQN